VKLVDSSSKKGDLEYATRGIEQKLMSNAMIANKAQIIQNHMERKDDNRPVVNPVVLS